MRRTRPGRTSTAIRAVPGGAIAAIAALAAGVALAIDGTLLWEDVSPNSTAAAVTTRGRFVSVVGARDEGFGSDALIRSFERRTGDVLWESQLDFGGFDDFEDVVARGPRVFGTGEADDSDDVRSLLGAANDLDTGERLWAVTFNTGGQTVGEAAAALGGRFFAAGRTNPGSGNDFLVVAFDARTGDILWTDQFDGGLNDEADDVDASGVRVVAVGETGSVGQDRDFLVRALLPRSGELRWEDQLDLAGGADSAEAVDVRGGRVVAVGFGTNEAGDLDWVVRAYQTGRGSLAWEDLFDAGADERALGVAQAGGRVFVVGVGPSEAGDDDVIVRAYRAGRGELIWQAAFDRGGDDSVLAGSPIAANGRRVVVSLTSEAGADTGVNDIVTWALRARTGEELGVDVFSSGDDDRARGVALQGRRVFSIGDADNPLLADPWVVRALR